MRRAAPLILFAAAGCQPEEPLNVKTDIVGVWLRNDASFTNGISKDGLTTSFEEFGKESAYVAVEHRKTSKFETYTITSGRWNYYDSVFTVRYSYRYTFTLRPEKAAEREAFAQSVEMKISDLDKSSLKYENPGEGVVAFVKGEYPAGVDLRYLRPFRSYYEMHPELARR